MPKIPATSSIQSKRIHSSFVERTRTLGERATSVDPVNPVTPVENETAYSSANHLMSSDAFYEKLEELKKEYLDFYHNERNLKEAIEQIEENIDLDLKHMKNLINKYNKAMLSLEHFDKQLETNHKNNIKIILKQYESNLNKIGIYIIENKLLELDEYEFKSALINSKNNLDELLNPIRYMILQLYKEFRNIQIPNRESLDVKYEELTHNDYSGIILDKKS